MMYLSKQYIVHEVEEEKWVFCMLSLSLSLSLSLILNQMSLQILVHWYTDKYEWKERGELNVIYSLQAAMFCISYIYMTIYIKTNFRLWFSGLTYFSKFFIPISLEISTFCRYCLSKEQQMN